MCNQQSYRRRGALDLYSFRDGKR